jgi:iron complex transport system substrate-binding protein
MRIASLLASGTELVCALGLGEKLVGRSHECDHPPWVRRLPALSRPTFDVTGSSRDIDERVRARLRAGEPLYEIDEARLAELEPDVIITQTHCEVCAASPADLAHAPPALRARRKVVAFTGATLGAVLTEMREVAAVLGVPGEGAALTARLEAQVASVAAASRGLPRPRVCCLEWIDPVFPMSNWGPELVEAAGGTCLLGAVGAHSTSTPWQRVLDADPEVLVVAPCGFTIERTLPEMPLLAALPGWRDLGAVRAGHVYVADGNLYFNRSGPGLFETAEILAEILHPDAFSPRHQGTAWVTAAV